MRRRALAAPRPAPLRAGAPAAALTAVLAVAALAAACGSLAFPDGPPTIDGDIVGVGGEIPFGGPRTIWVKEAPDAPCGIVFTVTDATEILERQPDGSLAERSFSDLVVGRTVRVWSGAVAESCPGQARATAIALRPRPEDG